MIEYAAVKKYISEASPRRTNYTKFSDEDRCEIGRYAAIHGPASTIRKFKTEFPNLRESTVRTFRDQYKSALKSKTTTSPIKKIATVQRGRPLLLGKTIDEKVKNFLLALRHKGGVVNTVVALAAAKALIANSDQEHLKLIQLDKTSWPKSLFHRMGFKKRAATTGRPEIPEGARKEAGLIFHHQIVEKIEKHKIPHSLIINIDQTPSKLAPASRHTLAEKNSKHVSITGSSYKQAITATFGVTFTNDFLPMQLIYAGKTKQSYPKFKFPESFSLSANPKHFSNTEESLKLLDEIIIPYVKRERTKLGLSENQYALLILDVFKGQMTEPVTKKMEENRILFVRVPANMTNLFQPLDLTVNGSFKALMKSKFTEWYSKEISKQLQENVPMENIEIKLKVSVLKPLHASWLVDAYNHLTSEAGREIIKNGWKSAGISKAVADGLDGMEDLDPFHSLDPLLETSNDSFYQSNERVDLQNAEFFATYQEESEDEYEDDDGEGLRNIFDILEEEEESDDEN